MTIGAELGPGVDVVLFGSRARDKGQGGDIDLLVESGRLPTLMQMALIKRTLEHELQMPVDLLIKEKGAQPKPFQAIARMTGIPIGTTQ